MKKTIKLVLLVVLLLAIVALVVSLAACKDPHTHTFDEDWKSDANNHWHAATCEHADEQGDLAKHTDANNDGECDVCQYRPLTVTVGGTYYFCENDVTDDQLYITFANGKWTDDEGLTGDYAIIGNTVTLSMQVDSEKTDFATGVVNGDDITLNMMGADVTYRKGEDISSKPKEKTLSFALSEDRSYYIVKGIGGLSGDIVIPDEYKRKPVKEIADNAFVNQKSLTSIVISNNVTTIGVSAFFKCVNLTEATLGESVDAIRANTFEGCSTLAKITIPASVKSIDYDAFKSCSALADVYFTGTVSDWAQIKFFAAGNAPQNSNPISSGALVGSVEKNLYIDNEVLTNAQITEATEITPVAFYRYKKLQSVTIGKSVKTIGQSAFSYCSNLTALDMSESTAVTIGDYAFSSINLTVVAIPNSVKKLGEGAFFGNENLTTASIGNGVTYVGEGAFMCCYKLSNLSIGSSVAEICENAFYECRALTSVTIPASAIFIGREAFGYTALTSAIFASTTGWVANKKDALTSEQLSDTANAAKLLILSVLDKGYVEAEWEKPTLKYTLSSDGTYYIVNNSGTVCRSEITIPEKYNDKPVRALATDAFKNCTSLVSITLPGAIMSIPSGAFDGCTSLESITVTGYLSGGYELVYGTKDGVLYNADFTKIIYIPLAKSEITISGVTEIADGMFKNNTSLKKVIIADGVTKIGDSAFYGCTNLTSITIGNSVTTIGSNVFNGCSNLTSVIIPNSVTTIGDSAFYNCKNLTSITIGNSVTTIGSNAFNGCSNLTSVIIPNSVTTIGSNAFNGCSNLTSISIGKNVTSIGSYAFYNCSSLTSIIIPNSVTTIGSYVFSYCSSLTSVTIGNSVTSIESDAFRNCNNIEYVSMPTLAISCVPKASLKTVIITSGDSIGSHAFENCSSLTRITIPDSVTTIGYKAFNGCDSLQYNKYDNALYLGNTSNPYVVLVKAKSTNITSCGIHEYTKIIYDYAFNGCSNLTSITIGNNVTSIGEYAFDGCSNLTSITIPDSVTTIGPRAFSDCKKLTSVYYTGDISSWCNISFGYDSANPLGKAHNLYIDNELVTELVIPDTVTKIKQYAFCGCTSLSSITIPNSVTTIGDYAFSGCSKLTSITIPNSVTTIGSDAFQSCSNLTSITIGNNIMSIGIYAFSACDSLQYNEYNNALYLGNASNPYVALVKAKSIDITSCEIHENTKTICDSAFSGSNLTSITIPNSVISIGSHAFQSCSSLTSISIGNNVTSIGEYAFYDCNIEYASIPTLAISRVPASLKTVIITSGDSIDSSAFYNYKNLTSITIGNSVTTIGSSAFYNCSSLTSIIIPNSVMTIGDYAFSGCSNLTSVTIPNSVTTIGDYAFYNCKNLTSITIGNSVTSIGSSAFSDCSNLTSVTIPNSVTTIGYSAFYNCKNLTSITIGNSVTTIDSSAFEDCSSLTSITIPNSVTSIGDGAFSGCSNLKSITLPFIGGNATATTASRSTLFGYIFGTSSYTGGTSTTQYSANDSSKYYIPTSLKSVTITGGNILYGAFYNCSNLTSVTMGNSVTSIGSSAFYNCSSLTSIIIPDSVTTIGYDAFCKCSSLTSITIPNSITSIGSSAFNNCSSLQYNEYGNALYLGNASNPYVALVKAKSINITSCEVHENTKTIGNYAFSDCSKLKSVTIGNSVTSIGDYAFNNCSSLTSVAIPNNVTSIGDYAFYICSSITSITIGNSVTTIDSSAFRGCSSLQYNEYDNALYLGNASNPYVVLVKAKSTKITSCEIHENTKTICDSAFSGCSNLQYNEYDNALYLGNASNPYVVLVKAKSSDITSCEVHENTKIIYEFAFSGCSKLTSITIGNSVTSIGSHAFYNCSSLTSITIGNSVTTIGPSAFYNCKNLTEIKFNGTIVQWNAISQGSYWESIVPATKVICSDGETNL